MSDLTLSIIIVNYNTRDLLRRCLQSIYSSTGLPRSDWEVIVVDNGSHDDSVIMIKREFSSVRLIANDANRGFTKANNQASTPARGKYLLFLNSDTEVIDQAIDNMLVFALAQNPIGITGGKLLNIDRSPQASCGYFYTLSIVFFSLFLKGDQLHITRFSPNQPKLANWVSGACLLINHQTFKKLGGFDERIFMYMDDVDLCFRAKRQGFRTYFYPGSRFIHLGSASSSSHRAPYVNLFYGLLYFYKKFWPERLIVLKIMLSVKAFTAIVVGTVLFNKSLRSSYTKVWNIIQSYG